MTRAKPVMQLDWQAKYAQRMERVKPSAIMELIKLAAQPGVISFASGLPDPSLFPATVLREMTAELLAEQGDTVLQYGTTEGLLPLRELIAERLSAQGFQAGPENILITHGSQQGIELAARLLLNPGDVVLLENPSYLAAIQAFDSCQAGYLAVPLDAEGMEVDRLPSLLSSCTPKLIYTLPNFQNPTGITLTQERRQRLLHYALERGIPILEDNAYGDLRYEGEALPSLAALEGGNEAVISTGTFSKTIAPGIRVAWVYAPARVIEKLALVKQVSDLHTNTFAQHLVYRYCASGRLDPQIARLRQAYRAKRDQMLQALATHMPDGVTWTRPEGGMFLMLSLPEEMDAETVLRVALEKKVAFVPGQPFFPQGGGRNTLRLNFVSPRLDEIAEGVKRLAAAIQEAGQAL
ncbi:MAG: PLP-dependent aminotransferase family protein [Nitrospinota bacterium]|nr:MAG: PLP-dependent aminotransferase family protein [Nitrospinota bacterium]